MKKKKSWLIVGIISTVMISVFIGFVCLIIGISQFIAWLSPEMYSVSTENGEIYTYIYSDPPGQDCSICGVDFSIASKEEMVCVLDKTTEFPRSIGPIRSVEEAVKYGATTLSMVYDNWTWDNHVVVFQNTTADAWIIHGQVQDRNHCGDMIGVIVLDMNTGDILGVTQVYPGG